MKKVPSIARSLYSIAISFVELNKQLKAMRKVQKDHLRFLKREAGDDPRLGGELIEDKAA